MDPAGSVTSPADLAGRFSHRIPHRRRAGDGRPPRGRDAEAAAARGRAGHREDRPRRGARPIASDGWERGDSSLLAKQLTHRVAWVNPHRGRAGYEPVQHGVVTALPFVDDFVPGHSMASFADLVEVVARA